MLNWSVAGINIWLDFGNSHRISRGEADLSIDFPKICVHLRAVKVKLGMKRGMQMGGVRKKLALLSPVNKSGSTFEK